MLNILVQPREVAVRLAGEQVNCFLFCLRLSFSGKAVHRVSLSGGQEAFFEGHEHAFRVLGGLVQAGQLKPLVSHRFDLAQFCPALELIQSRQSTGKVVLTTGAAF